MQPTPVMSSIVTRPVVTRLLVTSLLATGPLLTGPLASAVAVPPTRAAVADAPTGAVSEPPSLRSVELVVRPSDAVAGAGSAQDGQAVVAVDRPAPEGRLTTPVIEADAFALVGLTWSADADGAALLPRVRTRDGGRWSDWRELEAGPAGPDPATAEAAAELRGGTDPVWVGRADAVQVSLAATPSAPDRVALALVHPGEPVTADAIDTSGGADGADAAGGAGAAVRSDVSAAVAAATAPRIVTRAQWGAPATNPCALDEAPTLVGAVVHHTASANDYATPAQAQAAIRSFYAFHTQGRGWCDIGYNFLVDRWGTVYEGRAGSIDRPVIGVHTGGFNVGTVGVAMIGDLGSVTPPPAMQDAVGRVVGWRLGAHGVDPAGSMVYRTPGGENSRYAAGADVPLPVVFAHRDTAFTACPGDRGYDAMAAIRARAAAVAAAEPLVRSLYGDMLGRAPDPAGLAGWSRAMGDGMGVVALADALAVSREYAERRVTQAYDRVLGRAPDPQGLRDWTAGVMAGVLRPEDLRGALLGSQEYYLRSGGTDAGYVARLYVDVLGRAASPAEVARWTAVIPSAGRGAVAWGVWRSLEGASRQVEEAYAVFLDRGPDRVGLATWAPLVQARGERPLRSGLVGSVEYRAAAFRART